MYNEKVVLKSAQEILNFINECPCQGSFIVLPNGKKISMDVGYVYEGMENIIEALIDQ